VAVEWDSKSSAEVELRLMKGRKVRGPGRGQQWESDVGAYVKVVDFSIWRGLRWETTSDDRGRIEWADGPAEKFQTGFGKGRLHNAAENRSSRR